MKKVHNLFKPYILIALFIYIVVCISLYVIQFIFFAGALKTVFIHALVYPPVFILPLSINSSQDINTETKKTRWIIEASLILVMSVFITVFIGYLIYKDKYFLIGYQILSVLAVNLSIYICKYLKQPSKKEIYLSKLIIAVYLSVLAAAVIYLLIARPTTVYKAENTIIEDDYQNIYYVMHTQDKISLNIFFIEKTSNMNITVESLGVYLFYCEKNGERYGAFVDVVSGEAILYEKLSENAVLFNVFEARLNIF